MEIRIGVDENGKGALIGNMYVTGVCISNESLNVINDKYILADSKLLSKYKIIEISRYIIKNNLVRYKIIKITPNTIDNVNLIKILFICYAKIISYFLKSNINITHIYIDSFLKEDTNKYYKIKSYYENVVNTYNKNIILKIINKADKIYKEVMIASILGKYKREINMNYINKFCINNFNLQIYSGYPSDVNCINNLKIIKNKFGLNLLSTFIRKKWKTML